MKQLRRRPEIRFDGFFLVYLAGLMLLLPVPWVLSAILAAAFHELCHALAIKAMGERVIQLCVGIRGAVLRTTPLSDVQIALCALAGPAGSLLLVLLGRWVPMITLCAWVQGIYNLLPLRPLDGGRALRGALGAVLREQHAERTMDVLEGAAVIALVAASVRFRFWLLLLPVLAHAPVFFGKIPCKQHRIWVQ